MAKISHWTANAKTACKDGLGIARALWAETDGQDMIEYAFVAGLIGLSAVYSFTNLALRIRSAFSTVGSQLTSAL